MIVAEGHLLSKIKSEYNPQIYNYIHDRENDLFFSGGDWALTYQVYPKSDPESEKKFIKWMKDHNFEEEHMKPLDLYVIENNRKNNYDMGHYNSMKMTTPYSVMDKIGTLSWPQLGKMTTRKYIEENKLSWMDFYNTFDMNETFEIKNYYDHGMIWDVYLAILDQWSKTITEDNPFYELSNILIVKYSDHFTKITDILALSKDTYPEYGSMFVPDHDEKMKKIRLYRCDGNQITMGFETSNYYHMVHYGTS